MLEHDLLLAAEIVEVEFGLERAHAILRAMCVMHPREHVVAEIALLASLLLLLACLVVGHRGECGDGPVGGVDCFGNGGIGDERCSLLRSVCGLECKRRTGSHLREQRLGLRAACGCDRLLGLALAVAKLGLVGGVLSRHEGVHAEDDHTHQRAEHGPELAHGVYAWAEGVENVRADEEELVLEALAQRRAL